MLFDNLALTGLSELLPGRLFTTRMPRNLTDPARRARFAADAAARRLGTVLILAETKEYLE